MTHRTLAKLCYSTALVLVFICLFRTYYHDWLFVITGSLNIIGWVVAGEESGKTLTEGPHVMTDAQRSTL